jgi:hypothetical protein
VYYSISTEPNVVFLLLSFGEWSRGFTSCQVTGRTDPCPCYPAHWRNLDNYIKMETLPEKQDGGLSYRRERVWEFVFFGGRRQNIRMNTTS